MSGKCPICDKEAIIIDTISDLRSNHIHYTGIHENEYYKHIVSEEGKDYIYKYTPARVSEDRFKNRL